MNKMQKLVVLIPCHNEEHGLRHVLSDIPRKQLLLNGVSTHIIVINNRSTDGTAKVAHEFKVELINEPKKGKGNAMKRAFAEVPTDADYVVMMDGDNTYKTNELFRMIEPLMSGFCDVVVGSRLGGKLKRKSLPTKNRIANWVYTFFVRNFYVANVTDVLSGYFAFKREVVEELRNHIESDGFAIEMEMITKMIRLGYSMYSVPITYDRRIGKSKLDPVTDGWKIFHMLFKNLMWMPRVPKALEKRSLRGSNNPDLSV